ncbi:hypothetical protein HAX54_037651, partial [Datura stramonium]|nr:hypothetical protein [Datura stramonium]
MDQLARALNTKPQRGLPNDVDPNLMQYSAITLKSGREVDKLFFKKVGPKDDKAEEEVYKEK